MDEPMDEYGLPLPTKETAPELAKVRDIMKLLQVPALNCFNWSLLFHQIIGWGIFFGCLIGLFWFFLCR